MLEELQLAMEEVEEQSDHDGYLYRLQDVLIVMILGLLCRNEPCTTKMASRSNALASRCSL